MNKKITYKDAGVDTKEGERAVSLMKQHVKKTFSPAVLTGLGSFGSLYRPDFSGMEEPVLVSGTDGVGTKLKIAFEMDLHHTVGQDCVGMCVNDILCQGAAPLFFLDYLATGKVEAEKIGEIVRGIADGCLLAGCALIGGETAEMPGFYQDGEYDMAGFAVGMVDRKKIIDGSTVREGDVIIGIPSSGIHSNGYSLVRKLFFDVKGWTVDTYVDELGMTLGEVLLTPTRIYANVCRKVFGEVKPSGMVHITGGGFFENIPRILPAGLAAEIRLGSWEVPRIFRMMEEIGHLEVQDLYATFNMGMGLMMVVPEALAERTMDLIRQGGEEPSLIGRIVPGEGVILC